MFKLSVFAFIFVFLTLIAFIIICIKEKRFCFEVVFSAIITFAIVVGVGTLAFDYVCGEETIVTSIKIDGKNSSSRGSLFMIVSDEQENTYWGIGSISSVHYGGSADVSVRITYLPKTKFILGIERYIGNVGDVPKIPLFGIENTSREYVQIYSNGDCWSIACVFFLIILVVSIIPKGSMKFF